MPQPPPAAVGIRLAEVDTPALVVDLDAFERNLDRMAGFVRQAGVRVRPHSKTHKSPDIAARQIARGAVGVCCQKVSEAEVMVAGGVGDVLVSNEVAGAGKLDRLAVLARRAKVAVCTDGTWSLRLGPLVALHGAPGEVTVPEEPTPLPAKCQDEQLTLEFISRPDLSVVGASGFELVFTNTTDASCSIWGWPGLVVESADGTRIGSSWAVGDDMGEPFVLANGDAAVVLGTAPDPAAWGCEAITADHLRAYVTSDGAGPGVVGAAPIPVCADGSTVLEIGPFAAA